MLDRQGYLITNREVRPTCQSVPYSMFDCRPGCPDHKQKGTAIMMSVLVIMRVRYLMFDCRAGCPDHKQKGTAIMMSVLVLMRVGLLR